MCLCFYEGVVIEELYTLGSPIVSTRSVNVGNFLDTTYKAADIEVMSTTSSTSSSWSFGDVLRIVGAASTIMFAVLGIFSQQTKGCDSCFYTPLSSWTWMSVLL